MILGIMQPYFLPYFEHFRLLAACDHWVLFDTAQFTRKSWMCRNRVLDPNKGEAYVSLPVRHTGLDTRICDAEVDGSRDWRQALQDRLQVYRGHAPYYAQVTGLLRSALGCELRTVVDVNHALLRAVAIHLEIDTPMSVCSAMDIALPNQCAPGEWALHIGRALGATEYRNPAGGRALFDPDQFEKHGIRLSFHEPRPRRYTTGDFAFVPDLSIVDWLMWNDREVLIDWLR